MIVVQDCVLRFAFKILFSSFVGLLARPRLRSRPGYSQERLQLATGRKTSWQKAWIVYPEKLTTFCSLLSNSGRELANLIRINLMNCQIRKK